MSGSVALGMGTQARRARQPLAQDVVASFRVVAAAGWSETAGKITLSRTVCRMPDGRLVLVETDGFKSFVIGAPVAPLDVFARARKTLEDSDGAGDAHTLALLLCVLDPDNTIEGAVSVTWPVRT